MTKICRVCHRPLTELELLDHVCGVCSFGKDLKDWDDLTNSKNKHQHDPEK